LRLAPLRHRFFSGGEGGEERLERSLRLGLFRRRGKSFSGGGYIEKEERVVTIKVIESGLREPLLLRRMRRKELVHLVQEKEEEGPR